MSKDNNINFFDKFGLEIQSGTVDVGQTYSIYGMITKIISDVPGSVIVELNFNIQAQLNITEHDKVELIKTRAFDPGIFVSTVISKEPIVSVNCTTVVFGKKQTEVQ